MTLKEAERLFRSLKHYETLSQGVTEKRARFLYLVEQYEIRYLNGYEIEVTEGDIRYRKLPTQPYTQLKLDLGEQDLHY